MSRDVQMKDFVNRMALSLLLCIASIIAMALGWLRLRGGNLRQCILLHSLNNSLAIVALYLGKQ